MTTRLGMACIHGEENAAAMRAARNRVSDILKINDAEGQATFSTDVIYALMAWFTPGWEIAGVYADMWMIVSLQQSWGSDPQELSIECDNFEDGLAALFLHVYDNYERDAE